MPQASEILNSCWLRCSDSRFYDKETAETRYFISSLGMGVKRLARGVRQHWAIENTCHWCLDITYREVESRIRDEYHRENIAWLNRFTLSLLKQNGNGKSVAMN